MIQCFVVQVSAIHVKSYYGGFILYVSNECYSFYRRFTRTAKNHTQEKS